MTEKWVFVDESGTEPRRRRSASTREYFALTAVAVNDAEATRTVLTNALHQLRYTVHASEADRVVARGHFHARDDRPEVRRYFLSRLSDLSFHCRTAVLMPGSPPARSAFDALIAEHFGWMLPPGGPADIMHIVVALRLAQTSGKGPEYENILSAFRGRLDRNFPSIAASIPAQRAVTSDTPTHEPCLQLPDYCGWAVQRYLRYSQGRWLRALRPQGPGWHYDDQGSLRLPPGMGSVYKDAGEICGLDFHCGS